MAHFEPIKIHSRIEYDEYWERVKASPDKHNLNEPEIEWNITTIEDASSEDVRELFGNNVCILDEFIRYRGHDVLEGWGKEINYEDVYKLKGVQITNEDFYWILQRGDKTKYLTCCAQIIPVNGVA